MSRFKLTLEYDGTPYAGWQWQDDQPSVQQALETAVYAFAQERVRLHCAGRTDAGVHATGQVAHLDLQAGRTPYQIMEGLNHHLTEAGEPVRVLACETVSDAFHARFSACRRAYRYRLINRRAPLALEANRAWQVRWPLDVAAMREGAHYLLGKHDFTSFRAVGCQAESPVKTLDRLDIVQQGEAMTFEVEARSFLHHQVRILIGTLEKVGSGKWLPEDIKAILEARDRRAAGPTAPACGLYLTRVEYEYEPEP